MKHITILASLGILALLKFEAAALEIDWKSLEQGPPANLVATAKARQKGVISIIQMPKKSTLPIAAAAGFFVRDNGLAVCSLTLLAEPLNLRFLAYDGSNLGSPHVLAVFGELELALLRFTDPSEASLELAPAAPVSGAWLAFLSADSGSDPLPGGVLYSLKRGDSGMKLKAGFKRPDYYLVAAGNSPKIVGNVRMGTPLLDSEGRVAAIYASSQPVVSGMGMVIRFVLPTADLNDRIDVALKLALDLPIPVPEEHLPYDPVVLSSLRFEARDASRRADWPTARERARALVNKFPDSTVARAEEYIMALNSPPGDVLPDDLFRLAVAMKPTADAGPVIHALYQTELGQAAMQARRPEEAKVAFRKAIELDLYTSGLASANLGFYALHDQDYPAAEHHYQKAIESSPARIDYLDRYEQVLWALGKSKEAEEVSSRVYLLEKLFSLQ